MALTPNLSKVRVTGSYVDPQGVSDSGSVSFQLSTYLIDPVFNQTVTNQTITCQLVDGQIYDQGHVGVDLVATNDPDLYPGSGAASAVVWNVIERISGLPERRYSIQLDYTWQFYDLADLRDLAGNVGVGTGYQENTGGTVTPGGSGGSGGDNSSGPHAATHAIGGSDPVTPAAIGAAPASEVTDRIDADSDLRADLDAALSRIDSIEAAASSIPTPPSAPLNVRASPGDGRVIVTFDPPSSNGGSPVTGYRVGLDSGVTISGVTSPIIVSGLPNGFPVYVSVVAFNGAGVSDAALPVGPVTPAAVQAVAPDAPSNVSAAAGAGQAVVSFTPSASNGGAQIVGYRVTSSSGQSATGTSSPITVTDLPNGKAVSFTVAAINSVGTSVASLPSQYVTPVTVPDAPLNVSVAAGDGQVVVSWTAPVSSGGSDVTGYIVTASTGQSVTAVQSPVTVTGLANGNAVTFTVRARNAQGSSAASMTSQVVTPTPPAPAPNAPSSPTAVSVTVGQSAGQAVFSWSAPVNVGSSPVSGYTVTRSGVDSSGSSFAPVTVAASVNAYTFNNLVAGNTYALNVTAVNAVGSSASSTVTATIPGAGTATGVNLFTIQQESIESSDLSGFIVNGTGITLSRDTAWSGAGTSSIKVLASAAATNTSGVNIEKAQVTPGKTYRYTSTLYRGTDKPIGATIKWRDANNNALSNTDVVAFVGTVGATNSISVDGVAPVGAVYARVTIQFNSTPFASEYFNLDGNRFVEVGTSTGGNTTPTKPEQVAVTIVDNTATIKWSYPTSAVTAQGYTVSRDGTDSTGSGAYSTSVDSTYSEFTFTKLTYGATYNFTVTAFNAAGNGPAYTVTAMIPTQTINVNPYPSDTTFPSENIFPGGAVTIVTPSAPANVAVSSVTADRKPTITWVAPTNTGGAAISGYYVNWKTSDGSTGAQQTVSATTTTYTYVTGFAASVTVTFTVQAVNSAGAGVGGSVTYTMPADTALLVPAAPATVTATANSSGDVTVTWTAPPSNGSPALTGYYAGRNGTDSTGYGPWTSALLPSSTTSQTFTNLIQNQTYVFTVQAVNSNGPGPSKTASATIPTPPVSTTVSVSPSPNALAVSWSLPSGSVSSLVTTTGFTASYPQPTNSTTVTGLTAGTAYTVTVTVTLTGGSTVTASASGTPTASTTGGNPLGLKAMTAGASVTGAAAGEFNTFAGKRVNGLYATWGQNAYWKETNAGKVWGFVNGANGEYGSSKLSTLGRFDFDIAPQFGVKQVDGSGNTTAGSWATAANDTSMKAWLIDQWNELKTYIWFDNTQRVYIRPYHEFNGNWYGTWRVTSAADAANFVAHWRNVIKPAFDTVFGSDPRVLLEWCPNRDSSYSYNVTAAYPGADYVDVHGVDYYDFGFKGAGLPISDAAWTAEITATQNGGPKGLQTHLDFASQNGKPLLIPEMGQQFNDRPDFLSKFAAFVNANRYTGSGSPAGKIPGYAYHNLKGGSPDPNAGGDFMIQSGGGIYNVKYGNDSVRPNASAVWRSNLQNSTLRVV